MAQSRVRGRQPPPLPDHLSYKSTLALVPPEGIAEPIQALRKEHDRHFARWPPHINLVYPFLARPSERMEGPADGQSIRSRISRALRSVQPFDVHFSSVSQLQHGKQARTIVLKPVESATGSELATSLVLLQSKLQSEFVECDADIRTFVPHLSLGQAKDPSGAEAIEAEARQVLRDSLASPNREPRGSGSESITDGSWKLSWHIDRLYVLERWNYEGRFQVVAEIELGKG